MTITERDFETGTDRHVQLALAQRVSVEADASATAEQWAHRMIEAISGSAPGTGEPVHVGYFMIEDVFHKETHSHFTAKLGIGDELPTAPEPQLVYVDNGASLWREGQFRDVNDPESCFGIQYWATAESPA